MAQYIEFNEVMPPPEGVWVIRNKRSNDSLGRIEWYKRLGCYVTVFAEDTIWSEGCLRDVAAFVASRDMNESVATREAKK